MSTATLRPAFSTGLDQLSRPGSDVVLESRKVDQLLNRFVWGHCAVRYCTVSRRELASRASISAPFSGDSDSELRIMTLYASPAST